jgi:hypothetical protein
MNINCVFHTCLICILFLTYCNSKDHTYQPQPSTTPAIDIGDGGLISGEPCGPPCFYGIRPDITTFQEVDKILSLSTFGAFCERFDDTKTSGFRGFACGEAFTIVFVNHSDDVYSLGYTPKQSITIGEVIEKYGEPSSVAVITGGYKESTSMMRIYFSQYSMSIAMNEINGTSYLIQSSSIIGRVSYEGKNSYQELTSLLNQKWVGYGEYIMR